VSPKTCESVTSVIAGEFESAAPIRTLVGEAPHWNHHAGELWWVDVHGASMHRLDLATGVVDSRYVAERVTFVVPSTGSSMIVGYCDGIGHIPGQDDPIDDTLRVESERSDTRINDGKCDSLGRLWFGSLNRRGERGQCSLYRLDPTGDLAVVVSGVSISNGLAWSPDENYFYFVDTAMSRIDVFDYDRRSGGVSGRRTFACIDTGLPDGLTVDVDGYVWVAVYGTGTLRRYTPEGGLDEVIELPVQYPTSLQFGGPALDLLFVTTSFAELERKGGRIGEMDGALLVARTNVRGLPSYPCADWSRVGQQASETSG
jgi:sugar lactone lactonase YvrE